MRPNRVIGVVLAAATLAACTGGGGGDSDTAATGPGGLSVAEATYGLAPDPGPDVRLADDVVIVGGGADSVRSVSSDALVWTIDADAPNADQLAIGSVMFLTGNGVGRVAGLERDGDALAVTLLPVQLTEIISDGSFAMEQAIDPSQLSVRITPDAPGALSVPEPLLPENREPVDMPGPGQAVGPRLAAAATPPASTLPPSTVGGASEFTIGNWSVEPSIASNQGALKFGYNSNGVVFGGEVVFGWDTPRIVAEVQVAGSKVVGGQMALAGINSMAIKLVAGSEVGLTGNVKARVEVPVEFNLPLNIDGIPFNISYRWKFIVETAFSAKNSTLSALGVYKVDGPLGMTISGNSVSVQTPTISVSKSMLQSLDGISIGVNGIVVAVQLKILMGLGTAHATAGPFVGINVSTGLTNGSSIGLIKCKSGSLQVEVAAGVGATLSTDAAKLIKDLAAKAGITVPAKVDLELGTKVPAFSRTGVVPNVPLCRG